MSGGEFISPGFTSLSGPHFAVATSTGLAIISDSMVTQLTGGAVDAPAAVLMLKVVTARGERSSQILLSADMLAALQGSLTAWSERLPVAERDQYNALVSESSARYTAEIKNHLGRIGG